MIFSIFASRYGQKKDFYTEFGDLNDNVVIIFLLFLPGDLFSKFFGGEGKPTPLHPIRCKLRGCAKDHLR